MYTYYMYIIRRDVCIADDRIILSTRNILQCDGTYYIQIVATAVRSSDLERGKKEE